jgi:hypothetical protein
LNIPVHETRKISARYESYSEKPKRIKIKEKSEKETKSKNEK